MMNLKKVTLELSSKPFRDESETTMRKVAETMFSQWKILTDGAEAVSILLWIADGSEILEYGGSLDQKFEWAYWCGVANHCPRPENPTERQKRNSHRYPVKYDSSAGPRPYSWLKRLIEVLREVGKAVTGKEIRIGATFDNGPEFAISEFKYKKHPEIMLGNTMFPKSNVVCNSRLHRDDTPYAAFPDGIPEGTSLGHFLGAQFRCFAKDLGYDYIWLSNGMGFGQETWGITGALFDKKQWHPEKADDAKRTMLQFWNDFTEACPGMEIETRGSNFSAGTEISTDAAPLKELYENHVIAPPVNSPWAALNYQSGLEIAAWMSHIAELPDDRIPYRFYAHDPWFMNSPWLDRYGRQPWDIYQPLSVSRIGEDGRVESANTIAILSVDDTFGRMPDRVPREVIPHLLAAASDEAPDQPGPLLWIYPFEEYADLTFGEHRRPDLVFAEEQFIGEAIQGGLPLNTVVSTRIFRMMMQINDSIAKKCLLVVPASAEKSILPYLDRCGDVLFYGTLDSASEELRNLLDVKIGEPISGEVHIRTGNSGDRYAVPPPDRSFILPQFLGGGLTETLPPDSDANILAEASRNGQVRALAWTRIRSGGSKIGFVRAVLPLDPEVRPDRSLNQLPADRVYPVENLPRLILPEFGWCIRCSAKKPDSELPRTTISRHDQAFHFSIFARDTTSTMEMGTPVGAPIGTEMETLISDSLAHWTPGKFERYECRCFAKQKAESVVSCKIGTAEFPTYQGRINYHGFNDAEVRFFPPAEALDSLEVLLDEKNIPQWEHLNHQPVPLEWEENPLGKCLIFRHVTGCLNVAW